MPSKPIPVSIPVPAALGNGKPPLSTAGGVIRPAASKAGPATLAQSEACSVSPDKPFITVSITPN